MNDEDYIATNMLDSTNHTAEDKKDIRDAYDRVRKLFVGASKNRNLDDIFLTRDILNYGKALGIPNTAPLHSANADYQTGNLWADIYNKTIQNAGLTDMEKSFLYCLRYLVRVESMYSQIVDKLCYLLVWQTDPPGSILGRNGNCCSKVDTVDTISKRCTLATKCEFLADNGFGDLADACDIDLRNATAHMTYVIGNLEVKTERHHTETMSGFESKFTIEGSDIHIRRRTAGGADRIENVDISDANRRLEVAVWRYTVAFSLCQDVHVWLADPEFRRARNNPDDPRYRITFSDGSMSVYWDTNQDVSGQ